MNKGVVQAYEVNYALNTLGWKAFQDLCLTTLGEVLGQSRESFAATKDGGRDGAFLGIWRNSDGEVVGPWTIQCEFTSASDKVLKLGDLSDEMDKLKRLAQKNLADNYIILTNYKLTGLNDESIREALLAIPNVNEVRIYGSE